MSHRDIVYITQNEIRLLLACQCKVTKLSSSSWLGTFTFTFIRMKPWIPVQRRENREVFVFDSVSTTHRGMHAIVCVERKWTREWMYSDPFTPIPPYTQLTEQKGNKKVYTNACSVIYMCACCVFCVFSRRPKLPGQTQNAGTDPTEEKRGGGTDK